MASHSPMRSLPPPCFFGLLCPQGMFWDLWPMAQGSWPFDLVG